jgi:type I restriction enzyme S subunit
MTSIAEVAEINPPLSRRISDDTPCSFIPMDAVDDVAAEITHLITRPFKEVAKGYTPFAEHDVLLAKITPCMENGKCAIARGLPSGVGFGSTEFHVIRASKQILPEWIYFFWRLPGTRVLAERNMTGTAGQKRVPMSFLESLKIPVPSVEDQRRLIVLLKEADYLRRVRRYALEMCDELLPAVFLEMFGDPVLNRQGWSTDTLESVATKITDGEHLNPTFVSKGLPIVMAEQVEDTGVNLDPCKFVSLEDFRKFTKKCAPEHNDILLVSRGATIGRTCVVNTDKSFCLMGSVILIKPNSMIVDSSFLACQLKCSSFLNVLRTTSGASAQQAIYIAHLRDKKVIIPPTRAQKKFAVLVERHGQLRLFHLEALRQADHLFQTLLHQTFSP